MGRLSKSMQILVKGELDARKDVVVFVDPDVDEAPENQSNKVTNQFHQNLKDFRDMGSPETITITVVPGDALNE